jgi:hypothetical protein
LCTSSGGEYQVYQDQEKIDDKKENLPVSNSGPAPVMGQKIGGKNFENLDKNLMKNEIGNVGLNLCLIEDKNLQNKKKNLETETNLAEETKMKFEKTDILKKKENLKKTPTTPRNPKLVKTPGGIQKKSSKKKLPSEKGKKIEKIKMFFESFMLTGSASCETQLKFKLNFNPLVFAAGLPPRDDQMNSAQR